MSFIEKIKIRKYSILSIILTLLIFTKIPIGYKNTIENYEGYIYSTTNDNEPNVDVRLNIQIFNYIEILKLSSVKEYSGSVFINNEIYKIISISNYKNLKQGLIKNNNKFYIITSSDDFKKVVLRPYDPTKLSIYAPAKNKSDVITLKKELDI